MNIKNKILVTFFILIVSDTFSQVNHVLNYSLEQDSICSLIGECSGHPNWTVKHWYDPTSAYGNWFSPCFDTTAHNDDGAPQNDIGYQVARTGQCYGGVYPITAGSHPAYITGTLSDSLKSNQKYCVTFYVSLADSDWWATNSIGAYFSNDSICSGGYYVLPYTPQIENPATNFITDKVNWVPVSGEFIASGGEIFITLGGFQNTTPSNTDSVGHGGTEYGENSEVQSYYYVDDVYVRMLTIANAGGKEDTICNGDGVVIGKDTTTAGVSFHWLPITGLSNPNIAQPLASPTVTTTYTLTVVNDSIHGCNCADSVTKDSVTVFVYPAMNITNYFVNDTGSNSGSAGVYITGGSKPYTYLWKPNGQTTDSITGLGASIDTCIITDANGCSYTTKIVVKNTTGINSIRNYELGITVFPNPNNGIFTLTFSHPELVSESQTNIEVYNVLGEKVYSQFLIPNSQFLINLSNQPAGVYFYRVITENGVFLGSGKLIINI